MTIITQMIADRLIMKPTKHRIPTVGKSRRMIPCGKDRIEVWTHRVGTDDLDEVDLFVLKFAGTAGRAERATYHPMDYWSDLRAELWSVNPPGYGGSSGVASVRTLADAGCAALERMAQLAQGRPILVIGNSLGTVTSLYLAAHFEVSGLILRNPPPLRQLIVGRYGWWNLWIGAMLIAQKVPKRICSIRSAAKCDCPAVFICSCQDRTVPLSYQEKIVRSYQGPRRVLRLQNADHHSPLTLEEQRQYAQLLDWLRRAALRDREPELVGAS